MCGVITMHNSHFLTTAVVMGVKHLKQRKFHLMLLEANYKHWVVQEQVVEA